MKHHSYRCTPVIPKPNQARPELHVPESPSYRLAAAIDKYYSDCINKSDLWPDRGYVAQMIIAEYGRGDA